MSFCHLNFIFHYGYTWSYSSRKKNINTYNYYYNAGKPYDSLFCSMYAVSSVTSSCLAETILIAMLFPFCCQVSTKYYLL